MVFPPSSDLPKQTEELVIQSSDEFNPRRMHGYVPGIETYYQDQKP